MALINRPSYGELMENRSIDIVHLAADHHHRLAAGARAPRRRGARASLRRGAAEALEAVVHGTADRSRVVGRRIEQVKLPEGASIVAIVRGEQVIMAHHDTRIETEDHVIVFLADRRHVEAVERLFHAEG